MATDSEDLQLHGVANNLVKEIEQVGEQQPHKVYTFYTNAPNKKPLNLSKYDPKLITKDMDCLLKFIIKFYNDENSDMKLYNKIIWEAIKDNNIEALECLWQGIYWHDRKDKTELNYSDYVIWAVIDGNLTTIKHCMYAFQNYPKTRTVFAHNKTALYVTYVNHNKQKTQECSDYFKSLPEYIRCYG